MPEPESIEAIRAVVDALLPPTDGRPGGVELGIEQHVVEQLEGAMQGSVDFLAALLNAYASSIRQGATVAELTREERNAVVREMAADPSPDIHEAIDSIITFTLGGMYSEWTGYDPATGGLKSPPVWKDLGFPGPKRGVPEYRKGI
jgi:hypothetical protein